MSKRKAGIAVLGLLLAGTALGGGWWLTHQDVESTDNAYIQADITTISPKVAGYVAEVPVSDNQAVSAGAILARLEDTDYRARVAEAEAAVAAARAGLDSIDSRLEAQNSVIAEAEAAVATEQAEQTLAQRELTRIQSLAKQDFASRQRLDTAASSAAKAQAGIAQARAKLQTARAQIDVLRADRLRQEALLAQATASLALASDALDNTVIRAPRAGVVGNRGVRVGQYVGPGSHLMALVPLDEVWIDANFKETQIGALQPGQPVTIAVDAWPDTPVIGTVGSVSPASGAEFSLLPPENATGNFTKVVQRIPVRIEIPADNPLAGKLRPGLSVVVSVDTSGQTPHRMTTDATPAPGREPDTDTGTGPLAQVR